MEHPIACLVTNLAWEPHHKEKLERALPEAKILYVAPGDTKALNAALPEAEVAVIMGKPDVRAAQKLKWLHWDAAGLDAIAKPEFMNCGFAITGSAGRSAPALAEHVFFFMLNQAYHIRTVLGAQEAHRWGYPGQQHMKALFSQTIGIVGMGNTGRAVAQRAKAFEMRVVAYDRTDIQNPNVDVMLSEENGDNVDDLVRQSDFIVMCCALTNQTYHMLGEKQFEMMKPGTVVINIGRGQTIDEGAMLRALREGRIAGAGLDTFEKEPLGADSPVWDTPNLLATPHFTPACPDKLGRSLNIVLENIERYHSGRELINRLRPEDLFTK